MVLPIFLHGSVWHILTNLLSLLMIGFTVENYLQSKVKYALVLLIGGIGGNLFSDVANPYSVSVGASGAIYALTGRFTVFIIQNFKTFSKANYPFLVFNGVMLGFGLLNGFTSPGVDGWGHLGGILTGILLAGVLYPADEQLTPLLKK